MEKKKQLSREQAEALKTFAQVTGRLWKQELRLCWMNGGMSNPNFVDGLPYLQQIRNQFGPSWLNAFKLREV